VPLESGLGLAIYHCGLNHGPTALPHELTAESCLASLRQCMFKKLHFTTTMLCSALFNFFVIGTLCFKIVFVAAAVVLVDI